MTFSKRPGTLIKAITGIITKVQLCLHAIRDRSQRQLGQVSRQSVLNLELFLIKILKTPLAIKCHWPEKLELPISELMSHSHVHSKRSVHSSNVFHTRSTWPLALNFRFYYISERFLALLTCGFKQICTLLKSFPHTIHLEELLLLVLKYLALSYYICTRVHIALSVLVYMSQKIQITFPLTVFLKDFSKASDRVQGTKSRGPKGPPARSRGPEGPKTSSLAKLSDQRLYL